MCTVAPASPCGAVAVMLVSLLTVKEAAGVVPKFTPPPARFAPVKFEPVIVTEVPAHCRPADGETPVTTGLPPTALTRARPSSSRPATVRQPATMRRRRTRARPAGGENVIKVALPRG